MAFYASLPLALALGLAAFTFLDSVRQNTALLWSFLGAATALGVWSAVLLGTARRTGRTLTLEIVLRKQRYLQACAQASVLLYYDKLLQVPLLNISIRLIDRAARSTLLRAFDPAALGRWLAPHQPHLAYMSVWAIVFASMSAVQAVGDGHPGQWLPFWQQACEEERPYACRYLGDVQAGFCDRGSGWACNERGVLQARRELDYAGSVESLRRGCDLGYEPACVNARAVQAGDLASAPPTLDDYPIILRGSKGPITERTPAALYALACREGWPDTCARGIGVGGP